MGNLGGYQAMTSMAKKVGGPVTLLATVLVGGFAAGRSLEAAGKKAVRAGKAAIAKRKGVPCATKGVRFRVVTDGVDGSGLKFRTGDEYLVLECDGGSVLIEIQGSPDNPHFVSSDFLATVSDFPAGETAENEQPNATFSRP